MEGGNHSGFEAPVYGEVFPAGSFTQGPDGYLVLTLIGAYSKANKILGSIDYCIEYASAFQFGSRNKEIGSNECIILKAGANEIDLESFFNSHKESPIRFYAIDKDGNVSDITSDVDLSNLGSSRVKEK